MSNVFNYRMNAARLIGVRGFKAAIYGLALYLVSFAACVIAAAFTNTYIGAIDENGFMILANPLNLPLSLAITIAAIYLAIAASISISRERDSGTLEVLFYGPVDSVSYILAKYIEQVLAFVVMLVLYAIVFVVFGELTNYGFSGDMVLSMVLSLALASGVTAFGILLSSITKTMRTSILLLIALFVVFLGIQWGESFVAGLDPKGISPALFYAKSFLSLSARLVNWISPFAYLNRGMEALAVGNMAGYIGSFLLSLLYSAVLLALSIVSLQRKGVRS